MMFMKKSRINPTVPAHHIYAIMYMYNCKIFTHANILKIIKILVLVLMLNYLILFFPFQPRRVRKPKVRGFELS